MRMRKYFLFTVLAAAALSGFAQDENLKTHAGHQQMKKTENVEIEAAVKQAALPRGEHDPMKAGVAAADPSGDTYVLFGSSMFDAEGNNVFSEGGMPVQYPVYVNIDEAAGTATVENILDMRNYYGRPANGTYDAANGTITIAAPKNFYNLSDYQTIGTSGESFIFLRAVTPYGIGYATNEENLVLNVSEDFSTLIPTTGMAASLCKQGIEMGYVSIVYDACIFKRTEGVSLKSNKFEVDFGDTYGGNTYKQTVNIYNVGSEATDYVVTCSDPSVFSISEVSGNLQAEEYASLDVVFTPTEEKDYTATLYIESEGETVEVRLSGHCAGILDYTEIVKEGDFTFEASEGYPWLIEERDGNTVAITSNKGLEDTESVFSASFVVPEKNGGTLSWNGFYDPRYATYDELYIYLDGEEIANYRKVQEPGIPLDISDTLYLASGKHTIEFNYSKGMQVNAADGYNYGEDVVYIYNLSLKNEESKEFDAVLSSDVLDFGRLYAGSYSKSKGVVSLRNSGYGTLEIKDIKCDNFLSAEAEVTTASPQENIEIVITVDADKAGELNGNVVIETNAGDFTVKCHATAENLPDFSQIVSSGEFIFDTDLNCPFVVEDGVAYNSTSQVADPTETLSYFAAFFTVPEGKTGKLRWSASLDAAEYDSSTYFHDLARITVSGEYLYSYYGKTDMSYSTFAPQEITNLQPGTHSIYFYYLQCGDGKYEGMDRLTVTDLSLEIEDMPETRLELWQPSDEIDFGDVYSINTGCKNVQFANTGSNALKFNSIEGDNEYFYGNIKKLQDTGSMALVNVPVLFSSNGELGQFEGNVKVSTTGGDVTLKCKANSVTPGKYLLVQDFELGAEDWTFFDCDEDSVHQFEVFYNSSYSYTGNACLRSCSYVVDENYQVINILPDNYAVSPEFTIPKEGATLSFYVSGGNISYYMENYEVMIGKGTDLSTYDVLESTTISFYGYDQKTYELDDYAGETVNIIFRHNADAQVYWLLIDDVTVISKEDIGVDEAVAEKPVKYVEYYSADGIKVENPEKGMYIRRTVFEDNTVRTDKIVK